MRTALRAYAWVAGILLPWAAAAAAEDVFLDLERAVPSFQVDEFQPDVKWSGRINTIAVHPTDPLRLTVASESGGLFQSADGGETWHHLDGMPAWRTISVLYYPADPQVLIATADSDFKTESGAGIWRSGDGGETWAKVAISGTSSSRCDRSSSAWDIAVLPAGTILLVATDCGIAITDNSRSWHRITSGDAGRPFRSVRYLSGRDFVAAGPEGVYVFGDLGRSSTRAAGRMAAVESYHALAVSPHDSSDLYLIDNASVVYQSFDRGRSWVRGSTPPEPDGGCGGVPFVRAARFGSRTRLYVGNRCDVFRSAGGGWTRMRTDHGDTRDLVLTDDEPTHLATDGGFHVWDEEASRWVSKGGNGHGLSALQIYEVSGQRIEGGFSPGAPFPFFEPPRYDLYIGTQDNDLWSSASSGRTWPFRRAAEGFRIDLARSVPTSSSSRVVFTACGACVTRMSDPLFRNDVDFPDATRASAKPYAMERPGAFAQFDRVAGRTGARWPWALHFTENFGEDWHIVDVFPEDPASLPQFSGTPPVAYFAVRTGADASGQAVDKLLRISTLRGGGPPAECDDDGVTSIFRRCYPDMTGHGGLGRREHSSGFASESVFALDPADPMHLIAPDPRDEHIKESWDGGRTWEPIAGVRELVTHGGALRSVPNERDTWSSLISVVSFHPENATLVLMGAREGGLYFSHDRGRRWQHVPGSERIPHVSSFHWKSHNEVYVSSYGRGLWRLRIAYAAPPDTFAVACGDLCMLADVDSPDPRPFGGVVDFENAFVTYNGAVMDARVDKGLLRGLSVTPGAAWLLTVPTGNKLAKAEDDKSDPVTEAGEPGEFKGLEAAHALMKQGWLIRGFTLVGGKVKHVVVAKEEAAAKGPGKLVPFRNTGKTESGVLKAAYLSAEYDATPGLLTIRGVRFHPGRSVTVRIDGEPVRQRVPVGPDGRFQLQLRPGLPPGPHGLRAEQSVGKKLVSESTDFLVPSADGTREKDEKERNAHPDQEGSPAGM